MDDSTNSPQYVQLPLFSEKRCTKCKRIFPLTSNYWHRTKRTKDGFTQQCKRCRHDQRMRQYKTPEEHALHWQPQKRCITCYEIKPLNKDHWRKDRSNKDGFCNECKACSHQKHRDYYKANAEVVKAKARKYYENNKEQVLQRMQQWTERNRDKSRNIKQRYVLRHYERIRNAKRQWARRNAEQENVKQRKRYRLNIEKELERRRLWKKNNPHKVKAHSNHRRALIKNATGSHTAIEIGNLYETQQGRCFHCGADISGGYHSDHWIPLSRGGSNAIENIRLLCPPCNLSKHDKLPWEWHPERYPKP